MRRAKTGASTLSMAGALTSTSQNSWNSCSVNAPSCDSLSCTSACTSTTVTHEWHTLHCSNNHFTHSKGAKSQCYTSK